MPTEILEVVMVVCFGLSWPASIAKSIRAKTSKGKSLFFLCCVLFGYAAGITGKFLANRLNYVVVFYIINFLMVFTDLLLYLHNQKKDRQLL